MSIGTSPQGRRVRDRIARREHTGNRQLNTKHELRNLILFIDDDLRETATAIGGIERFLVRAQDLIDREDLTADELRVLAGDDGVDGQIDYLTETLQSLRRRLSQVADKL